MGWNFPCQRLVTQWARALWAGTISCQKLVTQWARALWAGTFLAKDLSISGLEHYGQELSLPKACHSVG